MLEKYGYYLKRYFWSIYGVIGIVLFWAGIWDGLGNLAYLQNPLVSLIVGFVILISTGLVFKELNPLDDSHKKLLTSIYHIHHHPKKHHFSFKYFDNIQRKKLSFDAEKLKRIEKEAFLVFHHQGHELFLPIHRIKHINFKDKEWKLEKKKKQNSKKRK